MTKRTLSNNVRIWPLWRYKSCNKSQRSGQSLKFPQQLGTYTAAGIFECTYTQAAQLNRAADPSKDAYPFHQYAKVILRRAADGKLYGLLLYAPVKSMFSYVEEQGYRVKQDVGTVLASYYSAMAGETFTFHKGWLQGQTFGA
jgi:hypothetical protein